ncbi:ATP-dependent RecD-like DNA helicase [Vaginisenegalia massiliensis]|uniref:SF1B family DNA helicase RecD2 n=1 Tax=Vaginisenegalia massiliensis TaxID=2058294 RepID=UPI000F52C757|nr:ATP-dependent RecD-like DNA helicase [Vaginisenegalia massiliensis]
MKAEFEQTQLLADQEVLIGQVDAIFFENPSNFYKVLRVTLDEASSADWQVDEMICTGQFTNLHLDATYEFYGQRTFHPKYGEQFAVSRYQQVTPTSAQGLVDYLSSDRFKGVGQVLAQRIVDTLGLQAIDLIIQDPNALKQVKGMTPQKRIDMRQTLLAHQGTERVYMQLNEWGFGPKLAEKIYQTFQSAAVDKIKENPYILIEEIEGIGFNKADQLAENLGFEALAIERLMAGILTAVQELCYQNGDTYVLEAVALKQAQQILEQARRVLIENDPLMLALDKAILEEKIMRLDQALMIPSLYYAEMGIVGRIDQYLRYEQVLQFEADQIDQAFDQTIQLTGIPYDDQQKAALKLAIKSPMSIITGGPGTGKTTLIKGLLQMHAILHDYDLSTLANDPDFTPILLAAPTGRAAKRMQEMTGLPAATIHRLIGFNRESLVEDFSANELEGKLLIVDEMSMVDTWLMNWLMQAIPFEMQVVFVGDQDQLPSVGPGKVFADLIASQQIPTISLTKIYRQAQGSTIVQLAHAVRQAYLPDNLLEKQADRSFIPCHTNQVAQVISQIVSSAQRKGFDATTLQVLAPMYKGPAGINQLNAMLQELMNPPKAKKRELVYFDKVFRVGDKVLQLVNNAEEGVYNGDIGKIESIFLAKETDSNADEVVVSFDDDKELTYKRSDLDQLTLAYCCSIHKSQGSEYPLVLLPMVDSYYRMLRKDLLYTAITRAQQSLVLIGNPASFQEAVSKVQVPRQTFLADLLQVKLKDKAPAVAYQVEAEHTEEDQVQESTQTFQLKQAETSDKENNKSSVDADQEPISEYRLTEELVWTVDPMIGMDGISPYDFMPKNESSTLF